MSFLDKVKGQKSYVDSHKPDESGLSGMVPTKSDIPSRFETGPIPGSVTITHPPAPPFLTRRVDMANDTFTFVINVNRSELIGLDGSGNIVNYIMSRIRRTLRDEVKQLTF